MTPRFLKGMRHGACSTRPHLTFISFLYDFWISCTQCHGTPLTYMIARELKREDSIRCYLFMEGARLSFWCCQVWIDHASRCYFLIKEILWLLIGANITHVSLFCKSCPSSSRGPFLRKKVLSLLPAMEIKSSACIWSLELHVFCQDWKEKQSMYLLPVHARLASFHECFDFNWCLF